MKNSVIITLTTDFGEGSFYVAQMKGVILNLNENAKIFDISHKIKKHNIFEGAFLISQIWRYFPRKTLHIGVVDPGVGSSRKSLIVKTDYCYFIGPDNGLFSLALKNQKIKKVVEIDEKKIEKIFGRKISKTFHGRDIFAPIAALLSKGHNIEDEEFGEVVEFRKIKKLKIRRDEILFIDDFGNIILSTEIRNLHINQKLLLRYKNKILPIRFVKTYSDGKKGEFLLLEGSHGFLEIAMREENAAKKLNAKVGDKIKILSQDFSTR